MSHSREEKIEAFGRLLDIIDTLRVKCPWDKKQTNESLRPNTIEEVYELCDAILKDDNKDICKELGDVIMHCVFYAKFGEEKGVFDIADICNTECDKLIYRHPHVYPPKTSDSDSQTPITPEQVLKDWEQLKLKEKDGNKSVLSGVPTSLPSMIKAYRIQDKARNVGFDWEQKEDVWTKVREEIAEFEQELNSASKSEDDQREGTSKVNSMEAELGDLFFSLINAARLYGLNPDTALEHTNQKFIRRFNYVEDHSIKDGRPLKDMTLEEMDELWNQAKRLEL